VRGLTNATHYSALTMPATSCGVLLMSGTHSFAAAQTHDMHKVHPICIDNITDGYIFV